MKPNHGAVLPCLRTVGLAALLLILVFQFSTLRRTHFAAPGLDLDAKPLSYPMLGLAGTLTLAVLARLAGTFLNRREDYYDGG